MYLNKRVSDYESKTGFTLIEIMLVLTLIAILSSITMPSLRGLAVSTRLRSAAHAIRDMLHFARDMAVTEQTAHLVVFDLDQNRYWLASSETFAAKDVASSSITNPSNNINQAVSVTQTSEMTQSTVSRTSMILGVPKKASHNISFSKMVTNHNSQTTQINSGADYIYFSPTASSEDTTLYIQDQKGKAMSITVEAATGHVRIQDVGTEESEALGLSLTARNDIN